MLSALELKIPPLILAVIVAAAMGAIAWLTPQFILPITFTYLPAAIFICGGLIVMFAGAFAFRRAQTTLNPTKIDTASSLVTAGIFGVSRNPMYLGMAMILVGLGFYLSHALAFLGPVLFVLFINRFQIVPEERMMTELFGDEFAAYQTAVRRWV